MVSVAGNNPEIVNAEGGKVAVRFLRWDSELGLDALHVLCMVERLAEPMAIEPSIRYEYEFLGGEQARAPSPRQRVRGRVHARRSRASWSGTSAW